MIDLYCEHKGKPFWTTMSQCDASKCRLKHMCAEYRRMAKAIKRHVDSGLSHTDAKIEVAIANDEIPGCMNTEERIDDSFWHEPAPKQPALTVVPKEKRPDHPADSRGVKLKGREGI